MASSGPEKPFSVEHLYQSLRGGPRVERDLRLVVVLPFLLVQAASCLDASQLRSYLPAGFEGFVPDGESRFCVASNLTYIYDGGYLTYVNRGTIMVVQQFYVNKESAYYTVTLHWMNSRENASNIVRYFRDIFSGLPNLHDIALGEGGFEYSDCCVTYLYFWQGQLFAALEGTRDLSTNAMGLSAQDVLLKAMPEASPWLGLPCLAILLAFRPIRTR